MGEARARRWCLLVSGVGVLTWLGFGLNLLHELERLRVVGPPALAFLLGSGLSLPLVYAGWRLCREPWVDTTTAKRIVGWSLAGASGAVVTQGVILFILVAEGRPVAEPQLQSLVGLNGGALGGVLFGYVYERARYDAEQAEQAREAVTFMNRTLRHECLNGLNIITGRAEQIAADLDDEAAQQGLATIQARADGMAEMIDNIRSFGETFESGQEVRSVDLSTRLNRRVEATRREFPEATIDAEVPDGVRVAAGEAIDRVFDNLLQNAIEHNDEDTPEVTVRAETDASTVTVHVADNGPGIPAEKRESLFDPELERQHRFGLYLVNRLVDYYGGEITVSDNEPKGTVVAVELPRGDPA